MLIECAVANRDAVESKDVAQISLEMRKSRGVEVLLSESVMVSCERGMFVENFLEGNNSAIVHIPNTDKIQTLFDDCGGAEVTKIILTKEHPMFDSIIKMAEAKQTLS